MVDFINRFARDHEREMKFFFKKDEARDYSAVNGNLPMFSIDLNDKGGSKYVSFENENLSNKVDRYGVLLRPEANLIIPHRTELVVERFAYEVILEGVPLDLYLDIEGSKDTNPDLDFDKLCDKLLSELKMFMKQMSICPDDAVDRAEFVALDSSTKRKFSKHIIVRLHDHVFANNYVCGALMRNFNNHLFMRYPNGDFNIAPEASAKSSHRKCVLDFAVYTKNRDFRLVGSCKRQGCAQANPIRWMWMASEPGQLTQSIFFKSLVQRRSSKPTKSYITRVVDTLNDGIPFSSSLCTIVPAAAKRRATKRGATAVQEEADSLISKRLAELADKTAIWIRDNQALSSYFVGCESNRYVVKQDVWNDEFTLKVNFPDVRHCKCRQKKTGCANHKTNAIYFVVFLGSGAIYQMCASNTCVTEGKRDVYVSSVRIPQYVTKQFEEILGPLAFEQCLFSEVAEED